MIEATAATVPVGTWAKHNSVEVVRHDKKHGEEHRLQTVFRTVYYEFADGRVQLKNYTSQNSTISLLA
mgnify:FL=1|jgi:hypothetical protein|tara:strand:- start:865 stop:1068 length:204 start_codon:yes stop_codon:yes gene_type:complete